jgi:hypothetical protein
MKKIAYFLLIPIFLLSVLISGCSSAAAIESNTENTSGLDAASGEMAGEMSDVTRLAIGTLQLEETDLAVNAEQAAELLTVWQAYVSLSESSTTASIEIQAIENQIQNSMTSDQIQAIEEMDLSNANMVEIMQSLGLEQNFQPQGTPDPTRTAIRLESGEGGFGPGGGGEGGFAPGSGGGPGLGQAPSEVTPDPSMQATRQAMAGGFQGRNGANSMVFRAVITLLQSKLEANNE